MRADRFLFCLVMAATPPMIAAQPVPVGGEFQVSSYATGGLSPRIASDAQGNFIVVWLGVQNGIYGQRYTSIGEPLGTEFRVDTDAEFRNFGLLFLRDIDISAGPEGDFVVVWSSEDQDYDFSLGIFGQRFDSSGARMGTEFQVNSHALGLQYYPAVAGGPSDGFVVAWESYDRQEPGLLPRKLSGRWFGTDGAPIGDDFQVNTYDDSVAWVDIAPRRDGSFVFVWYDNRGAVGQIFQGDGARAGEEFQIGTYSTTFELLPAVRADQDGNFVVVWTSSERDGDELGLAAQRFDSAGNAIGSEFQVNTYTLGSQYTLNHGLFVGPAGDFVVTWTTETARGLFFPDGVFAQKFDGSGERIGTEFQVSTYTVGTQAFPAVAGGPDGFVITWMSAGQDGRFGVFGQRYLNEAACPETPAPDCSPAGRSTLLMKRPPVTDSVGTLVWRWRKDPVIASEVFSSAAAYLLCLYDSSGFVSGARVSGNCDEDVCWSVVGGAEHRSGESPRIRRERALSRILLRGRGASLALPTLPMDDSVGVSVQLHRSDGGACLDATYPGPALRNNPSEYRDRTP